MADQKERGEKDNWLRRLQEGSWEPEILISGIVLYGLFQIPELLGEANHFLEHYGGEIFSRGSVNENLTAILQISTAWLILGFISHLLFRSVWAAFVGLSYVYQDGPRFDRLPYPPRYLKRFQGAHDFRSLIIKLEKICSTIFAVSFLLFMNLLGLAFLFLIMGAGVTLWLNLYPDSTDLSALNMSLQILLPLYLLDYLTLGGIKRIPYLNRVYYPFYRILSWLTLAPLYRSIYYTLVSHHKKWKVALGIMVFTGISILYVLSSQSPMRIGNTLTLRPFSNDEVILYHGHYRDRAGGDYSKIISLPSRQIKGSVLEVFIVHRPIYEEREIRPACHYDSLAALSTTNKDSLKLACLKQFYQLVMDGDTLKMDPLYHVMQTTQQDGLLSFVDIAHLPRGMHELELIYRRYNKDQDKSYTQRRAVVEFYKTQPRLDSFALAQ